MKVWENFRLKTLASFAKGKVLDIGYNNQPNVFLTNVDGIDMNPIEKPKNYINTFHLRDDFTYPIENETYDTIVAWEVIEHVLNLDIFFSEIHRVLKKEGRLLISTPNPVFYSYFIFTIFNLFDKNGKYGDHVHLFCNGDMYTLANIYGFKLERILWTYWQFLWIQIPLPFSFLKFLSFQHIYVLTKK